MNPIGWLNFGGEIVDAKRDGAICENRERHGGWVFCDVSAERISGDSTVMRRVARGGEEGDGLDGGERRWIEGR